jgi:hypothetical protein
MHIVAEPLVKIVGDLGRHACFGIGEAVTETELVHQLRSGASGVQILLIEQFDERALAQRAEQPPGGNAIPECDQQPASEWRSYATFRLSKPNPEVGIEIDFRPCFDCVRSNNFARANMGIKRNMPPFKKLVELFAPC